MVTAMNLKFDEFVGKESLNIPPSKILEKKAGITRVT